MPQFLWDLLLDHSWPIRLGVLSIGLSDIFVSLPLPLTSLLGGSLRLWGKE